MRFAEKLIVNRSGQLLNISLNHTRLILIALAVSAISCMQVEAGSATWTSTSSGSWSTGSNWNTSIAPGSTTSTTSGDTATFNTSTGGTIIIDQLNQNIGSIVIGNSAGNFTIGSISGNALLLSSGGSIVDVAPGLTVINAPLILEPTNPTSSGTYGIEYDVQGVGLNIDGSISGGSTTGNILLQLGTTGVPSIISGSISNGNAANLGVTVSNSGVWILTGANSYSGLTTISSGRLQFGLETSLYDNNTSSWTSSNIIVQNGAALALNVGGTGEFTAADVALLLNIGTSSGGFENGSNIGLDTTNTIGGTFTYNNVIANTNNGSNAIGLTKLGAGTLILTGTNTYTGTTRINGGTLSVTNSALGGSGNISFGGGILQYGSLNTTDYSSKIANSSQAIAIDTNGNNVNFATGLASSNTGGLVKNGAGILTVSGSNSYSGSTSVNGGTLRANGGTAALGNSSALTLANSSGVLLDLNNFNETIGSLSGGGTSGGNVTLGSGTLTTGGNNSTTTFGGVISGTGGLTELGSGSLTLTGSNTFTGLITIGDGPPASTIITDTAGINGTDTTNGILLQNGTLRASGDISTGKAISVFGATFDTNGHNITLSGNITGIGLGFFDKIGAGILTLSGSNSFTGLVSVTGGSIDLASSNAMGNAIVETGGTGIIFDPSVSSHAFSFGSLQGSANLALNDGTNAVTLTVGSSNSSNQYYSGTLSSNGSLIKTGTGALTLTGTNTFTGSTSVTGSGPLRLARQFSLMNSTVTTGGITFDTFDFGIQAFTIGGLSGSGNIALDSDSTAQPITLYVGNNNTNTTYSGTLSRGELYKIGTGTLTLTGTNNLPGVTGLNGGTLNVSSVGALAGGGSIYFGGGILQYGTGVSTDYSSMIMGSSGSIAIDTNGNNVVFASSLSSNNTGGLNKLGAGTLTLSGTNAYSGGTIVNNGVLSINSVAAVGNAQPLGKGTGVTLTGTSSVSPGILNYTGGTANLGQNITVSTGNFGAISNTGTGTLNLNGTITKTGSTFSVTGNVNIDGVIQGTDGGYDSDMDYNHATSTVSTQGTYFGATHIFNTSTVTNGVNEALPSTVGAASANTTLILGDASETSSQTNIYALGGFTQTLPGITSTSGAGTDSNQIIGGSGTISALTLNVASGVNTYTGLLGNGVADTSNANKLSLTKSGTGTLALTNANTYTGGTTVSAGTLRVNNSTGSATGVGALSVLTGATLTGTGTVSASLPTTNVTISGTVNVGNGGTTDILTMTASGTIDFSNAHLAFNLDSASTHSSDLATAMTPRVNFSNTTLTLNLVGSTPILVATDYTLFSNTETSDIYTGLTLSGSIITAGLHATVTGTNAGLYGGSHLELVDNGFGGDNIVVVVPEPNTWDLTLGGLSILIFWQRRRKTF